MKKSIREYLLMLTICATFSLAGCDGDPSPDSPQFKAGYQAGYDDGMAAGENNLCRQINSDSSQIHDWLKDHKICQ